MRAIVAHTPRLAGIVENEFEIDAAARQEIRHGPALHVAQLRRIRQHQKSFVGITNETVGIEQNDGVAGRLEERRQRLRGFGARRLFILDGGHAAEHENFARGAKEIRGQLEQATIASGHGLDPGDFIRGGGGTQLVHERATSLPFKGLRKGIAVQHVALGAQQKRRGGIDIADATLIGVDQHKRSLGGFEHDTVTGLYAAELLKLAFAGHLFAHKPLLDFRQGLHIPAQQQNATALGFAVECVAHRKFPIGIVAVIEFDGARQAVGVTAHISDAGVEFDPTLRGQEIAKVPPDPMFKAAQLGQIRADRYGSDNRPVIDHDGDVRGLFDQAIDA